MSGREGDRSDFAGGLIDDETQSSRECVYCVMISTSFTVKISDSPARK